MNRDVIRSADGARERRGSSPRPAVAAPRRRAMRAMRAVRCDAMRRGATRCRVVPCRVVRCGASSCAASRPRCVPVAVNVTPNVAPAESPSAVVAVGRRDDARLSPRQVDLRFFITSFLFPRRETVCAGGRARSQPPRDTHGVYRQPGRQQTTDLSFRCAYFD